MRARRCQTEAVIRPSVLHFLQTGDDALMRRDNGWLIVGLKYGREAREAYERGDLIEVRRLLASCPAGHNYFVG